MGLEEVVVGLVGVGLEEVVGLDEGVLAGVGGVGSEGVGLEEVGLEEVVGLDEGVVGGLVGVGLEEEGAGLEGRSLTRPCSAPTPWRQGFQNQSRAFQRSLRIRL